MRVVVARVSAGPVLATAMVVDLVGVQSTQQHRRTRERKLEA